MRMSFREERALEKKTSILETAVKLFSEKGYDRTTIEDIAEQLKLTKGSIYYYVKNKEDLLYQCHLMVAEKSINSLQEIANLNIPPDEKLNLAVQSHILQSIDEKTMFNLLVLPELRTSGLLEEDKLAHIRHQRQEYERLLEEIIQEGINNGSFHPVDVKMVKLIILGAINWVTFWYSKKGDKSKEEIAKIFAEYLMKLLLPPQNS